MRNDFEKRGEFSGRPRGNAGRNGENGARGYQNGGRVTRQAAKAATKDGVTGQAE